ncbi:hypothetical protein Pint_28273 [Pistacia integerrima]|uniref:Uncharacterized protein n=1 Tax=Pistacia integerrima TaxID=434235 RepID=A0ACC0YMC0_9ROSI|nr:hypothetical protein Pint_28273 [Pistacia integerrima]
MLFYFALYPEVRLLLHLVSIFSCFICCSLQIFDYRIHITEAAEKILQISKYLKLQLTRGKQCDIGVVF